MTHRAYTGWVRFINASADGYTIYPDDKVLGALKAGTDVTAPRVKVGSHTAKAVQLGADGVLTSEAGIKTVIVGKDAIVDFRFP